MDFSAKFSSPASVAADWLVVGIWQEEGLSGAAAEVDGKLDGLLNKLLGAGDVQGKVGELTPILEPSAIAARRLLVVGLGKRSDMQLRDLYLAASGAARYIAKRQVNTVAFALPDGLEEETEQALSVIVRGLAYGSVGSGIRKAEPDRFPPKRFQIVVNENSDRRATQTALRNAKAVAEGCATTRELVNLPPNELYPETFAERAAAIAKQRSIKCRVFDEKQIERERMGALLGVAQGSARPPRFVVLRYQTDKKAPLTALVGKGVTFDSGGLSLKSSENMLDMKCDMAGAATVLGAMQAVADADIPANVIGVMPLVENMPSGNALKLGDVLRARNGKTIEIHNTDAEGRLILADALAYAVDQKAEKIIDLATLTGACMVALGTEVAGLMTNDEAWGGAVRQAALRAGELVWPLPMFRLYGDMIRSKVADMKNTGGVRWAGAITAAKLLEEFVDGKPWAHLDIAGPAFASDENAQRPAGGTGAMVATLVECLRVTRA